MLRSLTSGVSGLINHQMKMDVLGNNIANINTVGYKGGRISFSEALSQTISKANPGSGTSFINPMQVGLGMKTMSIENVFTQGSLEMTGINTDMAIEGEGFFVLKTGDHNLYSRAGQFFFDADGRLVNHRGLAVQGWMMNNRNLEIGLGSGNLNDIVIDSNMVSEAAATNNVWLSGNLNAGLQTVSEVWSLNTPLTEAGAEATVATELNNLDQTSTPLVAGDTIVISGFNPDGSAVTGTYTYAAGDTVQNLLDTINTAYTGTTATFVNGQIILTDDEAGESSTTISLANGAGNTGRINLPGFTNTTPGSTGRVTTSVIVYDSLGAGHNLVIDFTKTTANGEWTWQASSANGANILSGGSGQVIFNSAGQLSAFTYDGGANSLEIDPGNGAELIDVNLRPESDDNYSGLTQFESLSTLNVRDQDGRTTGKLLGITIGRDGTISGAFSNGQIDPIAKLALAKFANNNGLSDLGDGFYQESIASGLVQILNLEDDLSSTIVSGALEMSNVDLSKEFTEMITAQRGFQANAKVITTADLMLDELLRLKR